MKAYREKNKTDALATKGQWKHKENLESQNIKDIVKSLKDLHED
jgi:hypothetical protein